MLTRIINIPVMIIRFGLQIPSLIMTSFERYVVGNTDFSLITDLRIESESNENHFAVQKVGCLGNHVAVYSPGSTAEMAAVLNQLDSEKNGRKGYAALNQCAGGNFLFANTDALAKEHRHLLVKQLASTEKCAQLSVDTTFKILDKPLKGDARITIQLIVRSILAKMLLGLEELPSELNQFLNNIEANVFPQAGHLMPALLLFDSNVSRARQQNAKFPNSMILTAADNLVNVIMRSLEYLDSSSKSYDEDIVDSLMDQVSDLFENKAINYEKLMHREGGLQDCWMASLEKNRSSLAGVQEILRYAENGLKLKNGIQVPPKTMLRIQLPNPVADEKQGPHYQPSLDPAFFSTGHRKCPGAKVGEVIFKAVIATLVRYYHAQILTTNRSLSKINMLNQ